MDPRIASFRESIDTDMCAGPQMELFDEMLNLDNDVLLNSKPISVDPSGSSPSTEGIVSLRASPDVPDCKPGLVAHGDYLIDLAGWEIKPWSFAQDICFQSMAGSNSDNGGWFKACQAVSTSPLANSTEKLYEYLRNKESIIRLLHKITLDILSKTIQTMESNEKHLRSLSTSELYGMCV
jgi:hypothetical protein